MKKAVIKLFICAIGLLSWAYASTVAANSMQENSSSVNAFDQKTALEADTTNNPFVISFYEPTYVLPLYYSASPDRQVEGTDVTNNQEISHYDIKFQLSFKSPIWRFTDKNKLYIAYTQMSYWQAYQDSPFFRETDYEPEMFLANQVDFPMPDGWQMNFFNVGAMHQSNGRGGELERSWNRAYIKFIASKGGLMFQLQPWVYIFKSVSIDEHNPDIGHYMGYEQMVFAYKAHNQEFALQAENTIESGFKRPGLTGTWSFPLGASTPLKGYLQVFSGYGQSLIEYNHHTNSIGLGIALGDWV